MKNHKDLDAWKESMNLVLETYKLTDSFPQDEKFGLIAQIRRSAVSIPSNIAEGAARSRKVEFKRFLYIALGSLSELETQFLIAQRLKYLKNDIILDQIISIRKILLGLIRYLGK